MIIVSQRSRTYRRLLAIKRDPKKEKRVLLEGDAMRRQLEEVAIPFTLYAKEGEEIEADAYFSEGLFRQLVSTVTPRPFLMEVEIPDEKPFDDSPVLVLDRIQDPGNLGTILRSAQAFGIKNVLSLKGSVSWTNEKVLRSSLGSFLFLNIHEEGELVDLIELRESGYTLLGADMNGEDIQKVTSPHKWSLVIGNEGEGLSVNVRDMVDQFVRIPMMGEMESLNAAVAASILLCFLTMK